jgi:hypothetical protein
MRPPNTPPPGSGQPDDFLDAMLREGRTPTLDVLLALAPDEPLGPPEGFIYRQKRGSGWVLSERQCWSKAVHAFRDKFPGYQPGYRFREEMKFGRAPLSDAPLSAWVATLITHAKAKWSGVVEAKRTRLQFRDWLPEYLDHDMLCWRGGPGLDEANQILRIACGLPRFRRTSRRAGR